MGDPGSLVVSGFVGVGIDRAIKEILRHISIAVRCRKQLKDLGTLLGSLQDIHSAMQNYRVALTSGQYSPSENLIPEAVDKWLKQLDGLLQKANEVVEECTVSRYNAISRYKTSNYIASIITSIKKHLEYAPLIGITTQLVQSLSYVQQFNREIAASTSSSSALPVIERTKYIGEPLIVGQDMVFTRVQQLVENTPRIGVVGKGGSGKTLLLKRLFNSPQVQNLFSNELLLWLTVSQSPSFDILREELVKQITFKLNETIERREGDHVQTWLDTKLRENKFALFLDDVWEEGAGSLLEDLAVPSSANCSRIIVSSRDRRTLRMVGISAPSMVSMEDLGEEDSWGLFVSYAFRYNDGNLPTTINKEIARGVCSECGGLPLAIKVIARSMSGVLDTKEWKFNLTRLQNAESLRDRAVTESLYGRLRLSYDLLAQTHVSLQLCFLYLATLPEDFVIGSFDAVRLWMGEGLLQGDDPLQTGRIYVNLLADRCLIEIIKKDIYGDVIRFRLHDVLYDLAKQIAEKEENCFFRANRGHEQFPADDCLKHTRISLTDNRLTSVPRTFRGPHIRFLDMCRNVDLKVIPKQVIGSMTSLRILDLSETSLESLPESIGELKHLVFLNLYGVPIKELPNSITALNKLQILDLCRTGIQELPSRINKLSSLKLLEIRFCADLQSIPYGISQLASLERFSVYGCPNAWIENGRDKRKRRPMSINDLSNLKQLNNLLLRNNGKTIKEGMLGSMVHMENLYLVLTMMERLPADMTAMSKLRKLWVEGPELIKMEHSFCGFHQLGFLRLKHCEALKKVPVDLNKIARLKQLDLAYCPSIEKLPQAFGERGAFPLLEVFSLMRLDSLEELPVVKEGAMPSLKTLTVALCEALRMMPENYWHLQCVEKIRVYGCSMVLRQIEEGKYRERNKRVQTITMSTADTQTSLTKYHKLKRRHDFWRYGEHWSNELLVFLADLHRVDVMDS